MHLQTRLDAVSIELELGLMVFGVTLPDVVPRLRELRFEVVLRPAHVAWDVALVDRVAGGVLPRAVDHRALRQRPARQPGGQVDAGTGVCASRQRATDASLGCLAAA